MREKNLIFIISQPRAGSTMLQAILSNNVKVDTVSESWLLLPFLSIFKPNLVKAKYNYRLASDALLDFQEKTEGLNKFQDEYKQFILSQYQKIQRLTGNFVLDKTPRYYEIFDELYNFFPDAKYIILKRHPLAVFASIMNTWDCFTFKKLEKYHKRDILNAPKILLELERKFGEKDNVCLIKYEDIVIDAVTHISGLYDWLEIPFVKSVLDYNRNESFKGKYGDPKGVYMNNMIMKESNYGWYKRLSDPKYSEWLKGYGAYLGIDFLKEYGYTMNGEFENNLKFRLFKNYCYRKEILTNTSWKDTIVRNLIKYVLKEDIKY